MSARETSYQQSLSSILGKASFRGKIDLIIGIPFLIWNEEAQRVVSVLEAGFATVYPDLKGLIICAVSPAVSAGEAPETGKSGAEDRILVMQLPNGLSGRGWAVRSLMDLAHRLTADLLILNPNLLMPKTKDSPAVPTLDWIKLMYQPVQDGHADFVLPRFKSAHLINNTIGDHLVFPLLAALYNLELRGCPDAGMTISRSLLPAMISDAPDWPPEIYDYGIDYWLIMRVLELKADIAEVFLGAKPETVLPAGINHIFGQTIHAVFLAIGKTQDIWKLNPQAVRFPLTMGPREDLFLPELTVDPRPHLDQFRRGYTRYYEAVWSRIFSEDLFNQINQAANSADADFSFPVTLWAQLVFESLTAYHFIPQLEKGDLISSLIPLFEGRLAGFFSEITDQSRRYLSGDPLCNKTYSFSANNRLEAQTDAFVSRRSSFLEKWLHHREALQPFLPEISYWEYIPGVPIILPHLVRSASGRSAHVYGIYEQLLKEYKEEFANFVQSELELSPEDGAVILGQAIRGLVEEVEKGLDTILLSGDLHTKQGTQQVAERIFQLADSPRSYSLKEEVAARLLREQPPRNLIIHWGYRDTAELLIDHNPLDVLALATWSEPAMYNDWNNEWLRNHLRPEHLELSPIRPLVVSYTDFPTLTGMQEAFSLNYITSRVVISHLRLGTGGSFPKTRFMTVLLKNIIDAKQFGLVWKSFNNTPGQEFGQKVLNSIEGHSGFHLFSAHSICESIEQQALRDQLLSIASQDWGVTDLDSEEFRQRLALLASVYHLGITLPDSIFVTCSLWSWASYSFKGGKGLPTPLSLMVERRWFSAELFYRCYEQVGGDRNDIFPKIAELMGQGEENSNLAVLLLGVPRDGAAVIAEQYLGRDLPPAGKLVRSSFNPILTPIADHTWESKYVLNCGAIRIKGDVHIFYRAVGEDGVSRIGLAVSKNGLCVDERLPEPVFVPANESEKMGCEDPRLVSIEGRIYMLYTAYDGITPQIALASIDEDDMIHRRWRQWHRHGLVFPGFPNKDAVLFPEKFDGKFVMYHRITPSIWAAFSPNFDTPWPREGHKMLMGSRSGMMWDAVKIGAGAQPLKTRYGWLNIYHGVDCDYHYRLGVFLTALDDPTRLIYRSPNAILGPESSYEKGISGQSWVPNVVFTCGAVSALDKIILDEDDEILVYYGGADSVIGVASARVSDLIPLLYRQNKP